MSLRHSAQSTTGGFGTHSLWYGLSSLMENLDVGNGLAHAVHTKQSGWKICPETRSRGPNLVCAQYKVSVAYMPRVQVDESWHALDVLAALGAAHDAHRVAHLAVRERVVLVEERARVTAPGPHLSCHCVLGVLGLLEA